MASLPLRPPVVLAKAAATLDLVTGGRVELGLGAGAFWDAIEAAGGVRRTPGEAVDALDEAIRLIRAFWAGGSVRFEGEHYRAAGLHAGPVPAHDIPIWVGAYKPRMMRLTGRLADGWVPSMGYADPPALPDALRRPRRGGRRRRPRARAEVRRIYNVFGRFGTGSGFLQGTPDDWAEQLAGLTLETGHEHLRPRHRLARRRPPLRHRGRARRARAGRGRARAPGGLATRPGRGGEQADRLVARTGG